MRALDIHWGRLLSFYLLSNAVNLIGTLIFWQPRATLIHGLQVCYFATTTIITTLLALAVIKIWVTNNR